tara:strand:- start:96 stop:362 length:267 start_codon:yes stop_codon:yes gene_type:complete
MEPNLVLSIGSIIAFFGLFYAMHKDSKKSTEEMADMKARVKQLEIKSKESDTAMQELLSSLQEIKVALAKIDTKLTVLDQEFSRNRDR